MKMQDEDCRTERFRSPVKTPLQWIILIAVLAAILYVFTWDEATASPPKPFGQIVHPNNTSNVKEKDTVLLIWFIPFGRKTQLKSCATEFRIEGCCLTDDRNAYLDADGVLLHHRDIARDMSNLPRLPRPVFQKWIWMLFESPHNSQKIPGLDDLFNVTMSYRADADILVREQLNPKSQGSEDLVPLEAKSKMVCWVVSNWNENYARVKYYRELKNHIEVELFGSHAGRRLSSEEYIAMMKSCKFYLSFENTLQCSDHVAVDYMTEKVYNPLRFGVVPVVLGPPRSSYEKFIPKDAFIHVDDFNTPKELANYLHMLNKDDEKYLQFFGWRKHFIVTKVDFPLEHACRACQYIRQRKGFQVFKNLSKWYWG
ncbi:4-galactosyl-N-acetylglucosaminide 3-alpha-L-fucosyltransferase 9-like [Engraulis encrasicolus]|uniref:4-galactosyl-N-acetylglucosaminide 3-alpha-L-fucosyltransferase 9-like n=1 Tax=Engraulis encrasicolus TaxID=184585 RepID=UPI002FD4D5D6